MTQLEFFLFLQVLPQCPTSLEFLHTGPAYWKHASLYLGEESIFMEIDLSIIYKLPVSNCQVYIKTIAQKI
jgi:hypothetical protein